MAQSLRRETRQVWKTSMQLCRAHFAWTEGPGCIQTKRMRSKLIAFFQSYYQQVPPTLASFSPEEPDIVVYTGYGMQKLIQFYSLSQRKVMLTTLVACWAVDLTQFRKYTSGLSVRLFMFVLCRCWEVLLWLTGPPACTLDPVLLSSQLGIMVSVNLHTWLHIVTRGQCILALGINSDDISHPEDESWETAAWCLRCCAWPCRAPGQDGGLLWRKFSGLHRAQWLSQFGQVLTQWKTTLHYCILRVNGLGCHGLEVWDFALLCSH